MDITILGAHNTESEKTRLTSLLIDDVLAIDAGALTSSLSFGAQQNLHRGGRTCSYRYDRVALGRPHDRLLFFSHQPPPPPIIRAEWSPTSACAKVVAFWTDVG